MESIVTSICISSSMRKPHIAIMPSPGMGHITPLLELAKCLVKHHAFHVSFLVFSSGASPAQTQLLESITLSPHLQIILLPLIDLPSSLTDLMPRLIYIVDSTIHKHLKSTILDLEYPPDALVIDMFCFEAIDVVKELSIPTYLFSTTSATSLVLMLYLSAVDVSVDGVYSDLPETLHVPGCNPMVAYYLGHVPTLNYRPYAGILLNTFEELESVPLRAMRENPFFLNFPTPPIFPIGPLTKTGEAVDGPCLHWLNAQPSDSVIFVSFGSGGTMPIEQITELAYGLEQSGHRFIWVVRNPTESSPYGSFFDVGRKDGVEAYLPKGFIKRTREVGLVVSSWAPQMAILGHQATGGFLSHCGWNSILESIVCGVPMIAWPLFADQWSNARMICEELGIAVRPSVGEKEGVVSRDEIERVIRMVMEGEQGKVAREKIKGHQDNAMKTQSSDNPLSSLAHAWKTLRQE